MPRSIHSEKEKGTQKDKEKRLSQTRQSSRVEEQPAIPASKPRVSKRTRAMRELVRYYQSMDSMLMIPRLTFARVVAKNMVLNLSYAFES